MSKKPRKRYEIAYAVARKARAALPSDVIEVWSIDPAARQREQRSHTFQKADRGTALLAPSIRAGVANPGAAGR